MTTASNPTPTQPSPWSANELVPFGKYLLLDRISVGSTAAVYRGKTQGEAGFERIVAVKRILPHMAGDQDFLRTFVNEAKTAARLSHTNICPIFELGKVGESFYMTMEYIAGKDLGRISRRLNEKGEGVPPVVAAWVASKLCEALDYAHNLKNLEGEPVGIYHRDLSPANILMSYEGQVKLIDFGVAKAVGVAQQTNVDALKKKLSYMSPEMVQGQRIDHRSDVFGVGVCLYEMVTARKLFSGKDDLSTLKMVSRASVPPPSAILEDPPEELEMITMRALEREPENRWQSADEMNNALKSFLAVENPTYGVRQLSQWMNEYFGEEMKSEQSRLNVLLEASKLPEVIEERKRFFLSPSGAAAIAKEEIIRKMSVQPPPSDIGGGEALPPPPSSPDLSTSSEPPTAIEAYTEEIEELDDFEELIEEVEEAADKGAGGFDEDAATAFYDKPEQAEEGAEVEVDYLDPVQRYMEEFDEDATQIFFNKEEGIGLGEIYQENSDLLEQYYSSRPPAAQPTPAVQAPPQAALSAATPSGPQTPAGARLYPQSAQLQAVPAPGAWSRSGWLLGLVAGFITLSLAAVVVLALREPETASMELRTSPPVAAAVLLDGVERGTTPMRMDGVPVGERLLEIRAQGYQPVVRKIVLSRGATAFLEISLKPLVGTARLGAARPPPAPAAQPATPESEKPQARSPAPEPTADTATGKTSTSMSGTLVINSEPWSRVFIDGKDTGLRTPIDSLRVEAGIHRIGLRTPDGKMNDETINVPAGQTVEIVREFKLDQ